MNNVLRWISFLVIGIVLGFIGSLLFNSGDQSKATEPPPQAVQEQSANNETTRGDVENKELENTAATENEDNILVQKGCIQCHAVSPIGNKGNGTAPDLAIAYEDTKNRFGKTLEEFLEEPEGTMSAIFSQSPLTDEEKQEVIRLLKEYSEQ
ncbi:hypothetical protein [Calidifontibacillus erzurumensis]|uniref:hypothetical protein n=1 Tax=Calidifontibacillus erzurumensis TaxID=2741433 RepID=UPI0035B5404A